MQGCEKLITQDIFISAVFKTSKIVNESHPAQIFVAQKFFSQKFHKAVAKIFRVSGDRLTPILPFWQNYSWRCGPIDPN